MSHVSVISTSKSEWIKFRSVRSTLISVVVIFALSIGLGALIDFAIANGFAAHPDRQVDFEPLRFSLVGVSFAQFVVGVLGAMFITSEYTTGSIRTTLAAVPRRNLVVASKLIVMLTSVLVISELITFMAFSIGQAIFKANAGVPSLSLSDSSALRGVFLAGIYLVLLAAIGFGLGLILRKSVAAIVVFVVILLVLPILVIILPSNWGQPILRYLPSELGRGMMSINHATGTFSPLGSTLVLALYTVLIVGVGTWLFNVRDA